MKANLALIALCVAALSGPPHAVKAAAYRTLVERSVPAGATTRIWTFASYIGRAHHPFSGTAFSEHGAVSFRETRATRCGLPNQFVREVGYAPALGFVGIDTVTFPRGHTRHEVFKIMAH